jgi:hypothetical protein
MQYRRGKKWRHAIFKMDLTRNDSEKGKGKLQGGGVVQKQIITRITKNKQSGAILN